MKQVIQLDAAGYFSGLTIADESPLEPGVFLLPAGAIDAAVPVTPEGQRARWDGAWIFEDVPQPAPDTTEPTPEQVQAQAKQARISKLRQSLTTTDYKVLPDYDKPNDDIKAQRKAWRDEIRALEQAA